MTLRPMARPEASFFMVQDSGHTKGEPGTVHELVEATERYKAAAAISRYLSVDIDSTADI